MRVGRDHDAAGRDVEHAPGYHDLDTTLGAAMALTRPAWSSLVTRATPDRPWAARPPRNASQPAPSSLEVTSMPRISRHPPALPPAAIRQYTSTVRPPSR